MFSGIKPKNIMWILAGSLILAFGLYNIHSFSALTEGGVLGLILLLNHHFKLSPAISSVFLNVLCYSFGYKVLGRKFIVYSAFSAGAFSLFYAVFEYFGPVFPKIGNYPLLSSVLGAVFVGVGVGLCIKSGGAPSGDDAIAMSLSKKLHLDIKWVYLISDISVLFLSLTYIPVKNIIYSLLTVILSGQIIGLLQKSSAK